MHVESNTGSGSLTLKLTDGTTLKQEDESEGTITTQDIEKEMTRLHWGMTGRGPTRKPWEQYKQETCD